MKHLDIQLDLSKSYNATAYAASTGPYKGRCLYVAYGSNLSAVQARSRCISARAVATAEITGAQLVFRGPNGFAHLRHSKKSTAAAVVYSMSRADLNRMDGFEGITAGCYRRHQISLPIGRAYIYLMSPGKKPGRPSYNYWLRISDGMRFFGFKEHLKKIQKMKPTKLRNRNGKPGPEVTRKELRSLLSFAAIDEAGYPRKYDISTLPCHNFDYEASVQAYPSRSLNLLLEQVEYSGSLFFFHGIFINRRTRAEFGVSTLAVDAQLHGFSHITTGCSNVVYDPNGVTNGVLAHVPPEAVKALDGIERCPRWYRREAVFLDVCTLEGRQYPKLHIQFYLMNTDLPERHQQELQGMQIGTLSKYQPTESSHLFDCEYEA